MRGLRSLLVVAGLIGAGLASGCVVRVEHPHPYYHDHPDAVWIPGHWRHGYYGDEWVPGHWE